MWANGVGGSGCSEFTPRRVGVVNSSPSMTSFVAIPPHPPPPRPYSHVFRTSCIARSFLPFCLHDHHSHHLRAISFLLLPPPSSLLPPPWYYLPQVMEAQAVAKTSPTSTGKPPDLANLLRLTKTQLQSRALQVKLPAGVLTLILLV